MTTHDLTRPARRLAGMATIALGLLAASCTTPPGGGGPGSGSPDLVAFGAMSFELPDGWEVISQHVDEGLDTMCVGPAGNPYPQYDGCSGLTLHHGDRLPGFELDEYQDHGPWGWYHETDVSPCPDRAYAPGEPLNGIQQTDAGYAPVESGERPIGGRTAVYDRWDARCESGFAFSPRGWHVNDGQVLIFDVLGRPETEAVLDSVRWPG